MKNNKYSNLIITTTDTVLGLGGKINEEVKNNIYELKGRDRAKKLIILVASLKQARKFKEWNQQAEELAKEYWPGNVTIVVNDRSGIGISIALNRFKKIRCARVTNDEEARLAKLHNNANILCFGGRLVTTEDALKMFHIWENTTFEGGRHIKRIETLETVGEK